MGSNLQAFSPQTRLQMGLGTLTAPSALVMKQHSSWLMAVLFFATASCCISLQLTFTVAFQIEPEH